MTPLDPVKRETPILPGGLTTGRAMQLIAALTTGVTITAGVLMWLVNNEAFPTVGSGLWWALQTVTTVGYGDHLPTNSGGRAIASVVMVAGIGFLTVATATISAALIESARRRRQGDWQGLVADELNALREEVTALRADLERRAP